MTATELASGVFEKLRGEGGTGEPLRLVALEGHGETRWLVPGKAKEIDAVLANWSPYRRWARVAWSAIRAAGRLGQIAELPGVRAVEVEGASAERWQEYGWRWPGEPTPVIYVGTPGPQRKAVVHLVEATTGECRAVVKVPLAEAAGAAIVHEAEVLTELEAEGFAGAPRLLQVDRERGISTQSFVGGLPGGRELEEAEWELLRQLRRRETSTCLRERVGEWQHVPEQLAWAVEELRDESPLPVCREHGDMAPWNLRELADGRSALLDWENSRAQGLPLLDAFHFLHMQDFLFGREPRLHWQEAAAQAESWGIARTMVRKLEMVHLVESCRQSPQNDEPARAQQAWVALQLMPENAA